MYVVMIVSHWKLTSIWAALPCLPRCLTNFRTIGKVETRISRLRYFTRYCGKMSVLTCCTDNLVTASMPVKFLWRILKKTCCLLKITTTKHDEVWLPTVDRLFLSCALYYCCVSVYMYVDRPHVNIYIYIYICYISLLQQTGNRLS